MVFQNEFMGSSQGNNNGNGGDNPTINNNNEGGPNSSSDNAAVVEEKSSAGFDYTETNNNDIIQQQSDDDDDDDDDEGTDQQSQQLSSIEELNTQPINNIDNDDDIGAMKKWEHLIQMPQPQHPPQRQLKQQTTNALEEDQSAKTIPQQKESNRIGENNAETTNQSTLLREDDVSTRDDAELHKQSEPIHDNSSSNHASTTPHNINKYSTVTNPYTKRKRSIDQISGNLNNNDVATTAAAVDKEVMSHKIVRIQLSF